MSEQNEINTNEETATLDTSRLVSSGRDTTMDISSLLKASKEEEKPKSNLEKLKEMKKNETLGLVVDNKELNNDDGTKIIQNKSQDDAMHEIEEYTAEQDRLIEAAKNVKVVNKPSSPLEMASMMNALEQVAESGKVTNSNSDKELIRVKTDNENDKDETISETTASNDTPVVNKERQELINVLIDKTGFGGEFHFTEEEKQKIFSASEIKLTEVEEIDLATIKVKKSEKSFLDSVNEFQISSSKVPVVFPASRFRAYMTGLSYGEMGDISLNSENVTFDQVQKKLTVIYNKMINPSIGKFENFEDFLRKFAYVDIDLAVYGLVVATFPEVDDIPLTCNHKACGKSFNHKFSPRTLIRFDKANDKFLDAMKEVVDCPAEDAVKLSEESPTRMHKRIRLPHSGFIVEIGIASSYDYLYTIVDNVLGDKFNEEHPDDVNGILQLNSTLLGLIRAVYVPDDNGEYTLFDEFEDMIHALYMIKPDEVMILASLLTKFTESYAVTFELTNIVCPHCGTKTESIPLDINYLVFLKYQRLMSTEVDINNISVL